MTFIFEAESRVVFVMNVETLHQVRYLSCVPGLSRSGQTHIRNISRAKPDRLDFEIAVGGRHGVALRTINGIVLSLEFLQHQ